MKAWSGCLVVKCVWWEVDASGMEWLVGDANDGKDLCGRGGPAVLSVAGALEITERREAG